MLGVLKNKLVEYMRHADIGFMARDSERQHDPRDGWDLYRCAQRLALTTLFTTNNAFKYVRLTLDEQYMYETNSELWNAVFGLVIFLSVTALGVRIWRDRWVSWWGGTE